MKKFNVGDKVVAKKNTPYGITTDGWTGYVTEVCSSGYIKVSKEKYDSCSWYVKPRYFDLIPSEKKVVITFNRWETVARLIKGNKTTKTAIAKCHPKDEFNFGIGAETAVDRLFETPSPKIVKCDKYKAGDRVKIVDKWTTGCCQNPDGKMDKWLGKMMTIRMACFQSYLMEEDENEYRCGCGWSWNPAAIEGKVVESNEIPNEPQKKSSKNGKNTKNKFKEGDIVVAQKYTPYRITTDGWIGYVTNIYNDYFIGVRNEKTDIIDVCSEHFDLVTYKVVVTVDSNVTTARFMKNKEVIKTAIAKCHPKDDFDFKIGVKLAVKRLFEKPSSSSYKIIKCDKYEVGDRVKIVDKWTKGCCQNWNGEMDKWLGKFMTIKEFGDASYGRYYRMEEDLSENCREGGWFWYPASIEGKVIDDVVPDESSLKVGTVVYGVGKFDGQNIDGIRGVIIGERTETNRYPVRFDKNIDGHSCGCRCEYGYSWNVSFKQLRIDKKANNKPKRLALNGFDAHYGYVGEPTLLKDINGTQLFIGDIVEIFNEEMHPIDKDFICHDDLYGDFVNGIAIASGTLEHNGKITGGWKIIKRTGYKELKVGDEIDGVKVIEKE